jgi:hypothetical protein
MKKYKKKKDKKRGMHCGLLFEFTLYWVLVNNNFPTPFLKKIQKKKVGIKKKSNFGKKKEEKKQKVEKKIKK